MATRLGIELSAAAIRLVEVEGRRRLRARLGPPRVRSFAVLPPTGAEIDAMLASLKGREAAVVVWGTASEHRQVVVTAGSYEAMRREAVASLGELGVPTGNALADIAPIRGEAGDRRPVVAALAPSEPMLAAIRPLVAAGIRVRSLGTPAMALASMAYLRREVTDPNSFEAYIAVEETATCIALMQDGALAIAHELPWGYIAKGALRRHDDIAARLALGLEQYLDAVGAPHASQVCICGGLPELRTTAVKLTERLDVEVEPLDALFGIDETQLPEPSGDFRERVAELRLAWAAAADWPPRLNLLRARRREQSRRALAAAAVVAGVVAGVGGAWRVARNNESRSSAGVSRAQAPPSRPRPSVPPPSPASARPTEPIAPRPLLTARSTIPRPAQLTRVVRPPAPTLSPTLLASLPPAPPAPAPPPVSSIRAATPTPPPMSPLRAATPTPPRVEIPTLPAARAPVVASRAPSPRPTIEVGRRPAASTRTADSAAAPEKVEPVLPFDASLETILYSADRRLAIVDGRIVAVGDLVRGARIVDISATAVMLRDDQGRLRRLALGVGSK